MDLYCQIDPGTVHCAFVFFDAECPSNVYKIALVNLMQLDRSSHFIKAVHKLVTREFKPLFDRCKLIFCENNYGIATDDVQQVQAAFHALLIDRFVLINPSTVKRHFGIATGDYKRNKKLVTKALQKAANPTMNQLLASFDKELHNHFADCYVNMAWWLAYNFNNTSLNVGYYDAATKTWTMPNTQRQQDDDDDEMKEVLFSLVRDALQ